MGAGKTVVIDGETYVIAPLTTDEAPLFLNVMRLSGDKGFDFTKMTDDVAVSIRDLVNITLQRSFPEEWRENSLEVKSFGMKYLMDLLPVIFEINVPEANERASRVDELKARIREKQA